MRLLITGGDCRLAGALAIALGEEAESREIDSRFASVGTQGVDRRTGDIRDSAFVADALEGVDVILHLDPIGSAADAESLDRASRGTYTLLTTAVTAGVGKVVMGSTLDFFDRFPPEWKVTESWRPQPEPRLNELTPWIAEISARECARSSPLQVACLRFGRIVDDEEVTTRKFDPRWLHLEDAVSGLRQGIQYVMQENRASHWRLFHIVGAGNRTKIAVAHASGRDFGFHPARDLAEEHGVTTATVAEDPHSSRPWREFMAPVEPIPTRPIRKVVIFGAGGPVGAVVAQELSSSYQLRLTDVRSIEEIAAANEPQSPGAPLPVPLPAPHECRVVDIRDAKAVLAACEGMDAIINCTVVRTDPVDAFRVNTLGAYHVMQAAVAHGIRRVVHTGPQMVDLHGISTYSWDYDVPGDAPPRPGGELYSHSKYLGQEVCRVFAEHYDLEVPVLLFCAFVNPGHQNGVHHFPISWEDSARAIRRALEVGSLPSPYEVMNVLTDVPHQRWSNRRAKEILDWRPRDDFQVLWTRRPVD